VKVSIITVVYNGQACIQRCIESVLGQDYADIEYIIVDGNSKDNTLSIIKKYEDRISRVISEPDQGIYDAMNKGVEVASGEVIGILNADDEYMHSQVISRVVSTFKHNQGDAVYGNLEYVKHLPDNTIETVRKWRSGLYKDGAFLKGWMPPHPTFFVKKEVYEKFGTFRLDLGSAADYELMLRMIHKHKISIVYIDETITRMSVGGVSNRSIKNRIIANQNDRKAWKVNDLKPAFYTLYLKPLRKILQFFKL
jgi:glycosyltransferase involved in cell wall biosynthesis